ncbi:hypothetical protein B0H13DRAFT_755683 [Mycena leptocephala]|nr:hypothetical protein B0H13DRAFT_755683 [Mycena leptocephala]
MLPPRDFGVSAPASPGLQVPGSVPLRQLELALVVFLPLGRAGSGSKSFGPPSTSDAPHPDPNMQLVASLHRNSWTSPSLPSHTLILRSNPPLQLRLRRPPPRQGSYSLAKRPPPISSQPPFLSLFLLLRLRSPLLLPLPPHPPPLSRFTQPRMRTRVLMSMKI